ncbi:hypothetical protein M9194_08875 [Vibrio sp. S4M6]|uniref:hypothetical protein n=1 Tax=Vibrio sinus TaxID=2946865 RepID=UPI002029C9C3|nr:hypothetical protein [Vibrio sinus]MCL9781539.1 hypothetical protein [Vibrio sinus]
MKILLVIDALSSGGAQRLFAHLACEFVKAGHSTDVFVYDNNRFYDDNFTNAGARIIRSDRKGSGFSFSVLLSLIKVYKEGYDHVFAALHAQSFYAAIAKLFVPKAALTVCEYSSSISKTSRVRKLLFYVSTLLANRLASPTAVLR